MKPFSPLIFHELWPHPLAPPQSELQAVHLPEVPSGMGPGAGPAAPGLTAQAGPGWTAALRLASSWEEASQLATVGQACQLEGLPCVSLGLSPGEGQWQEPSATRVRRVPGRHLPYRPASHSFWVEGRVGTAQAASGPGARLLLQCKHGGRPRSESLTWPIPIAHITRERQDPGPQSVATDHRASCSSRPRGGAGDSMQGRPHWGVRGSWGGQGAPIRELGQGPHRARSSLQRAGLPRRAWAKGVCSYIGFPAPPPIRCCGWTRQGARGVRAQRTCCPGPGQSEAGVTHRAWGRPGLRQPLGTAGVRPWAPHPLSCSEQPSD